MIELDDEEEEKLRDIAVRLGAAMNMHPEYVLDRLMALTRLFPEDEIPKGTILEARVGLALSMEALKMEAQEALGPIPLRAVLLLARILKFFRRAK